MLAKRSYAKQSRSQFLEHKQKLKRRDSSQFTQIFSAVRVSDINNFSQRLVNIISSSWKVAQGRCIKQEMFKKRDSVIGAVVCYLVLISLFVYYQQDPEFSFVCSHGNACVRFCCRDQATCNDTFIKENFNLTTHYTITDYKILFGEPKCSKRLIESHQTWAILGVKQIKWIWKEKFY